MENKNTTNLNDELLDATKHLLTELYEHHPMKVKKDFSLMVAASAVETIIAKAEGRIER